MKESERNTKQQKYSSLPTSIMLSLKLRQAIKENWKQNLPMVWGLPHPTRPEKDWSTQCGSNDYLSNFISIMDVPALMFSWQIIPHFWQIIFVQLHFSSSQFCFFIVSQVKFHHHLIKFLFQLFCPKILWKFTFNTYFPYKPNFGTKMNSVQHIS